MKKLLYTMLLLAVAGITMTAFVACETDDDKTTDIVTPEPTPAKTYAKYVARLCDDFLQYGDVVVTFEANGEQPKTYKMSEAPTTKVNLEDISNASGVIAVHELVIPAFEYKAKTVKATVKFELTEAGQKACEAAAEDAVMNFLWAHALADCNEKGDFEVKEKNVTTAKYTEVNLQNLPKLLDILREGSVASKEL